MYQINAEIPDFTRCKLIHERNVVEQIVMYAQKLPIRERVLVFMRYRDGYKYCEIAAAFGFSESTASRQLKKIARKLCKMKDESERPLVVV